MEELIRFFEENCIKVSDELFLLNTGFDDIRFIISNEELNTLRSLQVDNVVRFLNPKVDIHSQLRTHITNVNDFDDFDAALQMIEENTDFNQSEYFAHVMNPEIFQLFFLPSNIQSEIMKVTHEDETSNIDLRVKKFFLEEQIQRYNITFAEEIEKGFIKHKSRPRYSISFFKFFDEDTKEECSEFEEIEKKINELKHKLNIKFIQSFDYYFIGNIKEGTTLIERDKREKCDNPYYFHYNVWKLDKYEINEAFGEFDLYPFKEKEVV